MKKLLPDDPNIIEHLKNHVAEGWSCSSFAGKLKGSTWALACLLRDNPEFKAEFQKTHCSKPGPKESFTKALITRKEKGKIRLETALVAGKKS